MDADFLQAVARMDPDQAVCAFDRILAERSQDRAALLKRFRSDLPDLYARWLERTTDTRSAAPNTRLP